MKSISCFMHRRLIGPVRGITLLLVGSLANAYPALAACGSTYTVKSGDTLGSIALSCGLTVSAIEQANPQIDPNVIYPGDQLVIPAASTTTARGVAPTSIFSTGIYIVRSGDTLNSIAQDFGVSHLGLRRANPQITDWKRLRAGDRLTLPGNAIVHAAQSAAGTYRVKKGDTLYTIAQFFGVRHRVLMETNPQVKDWSKIYAGQMINIPAQTVAGTYTVQSGDTLNSIANAYNIPPKALKQANPNITDWTQIHAGQVINIPK